MPIFIVHYFEDFSLDIFGINKIQLKPNQTLQFENDLLQ